MVKNLILTLTIAASVVGCVDDGFNQTKNRLVIVEEMKTTEIAQSPNSEYKYVVRTSDGAVWLVECMSREAKITAKAMIFPAFNSNSSLNVD